MREHKYAIVGMSPFQGSYMARRLTQGSRPGHSVPPLRGFDSLAPKGRNRSAQGVSPGNRGRQIEP